ncbi:MAG: hypothetical protein ACM3XS_00640 [Bacteroidota bacterium]
MNTETIVVLIVVCFIYGLFYAGSIKAERLVKKSCEEKRRAQETQIAGAKSGRRVNARSK